MAREADQRASGDGPGRRRVRLAPARLLRGRSPWIQAPLLLFSYPAIIMALAASLLILSLAVAGGPLFRSAAGNEALRKETAGVPPWLAGLTVGEPGPFSGRLSNESPYFVETAETLFTRRDQFLRGALSKLPGLGRPTRSIIADTRFVFTAGRNPRSANVRPLVRTGGLDHLAVIERVPGDGVWITDRTAAALGVRAGDSLLVPLGARTVAVLVQGIYRDLAVGPLPEFWAPLASWIRSPVEGAPPLPALMLSTESTFRSYAGTLSERPYFKWEFPLNGRQMTLERGAELAAGLQEVAAQLRSGALVVGNPFAGLFIRPEVDTLFPAMFLQASQVASTLEGPIQVLSLAARIVALLVIAAVGVYWIQRRRTELRQFAARGVGGLSVAGRTLLEAAPAAAAGGIAGWLAAAPLIRRLGPTRLLSPPVLHDALRQTLRMDLVGLFLLAVVVGVGARLEARTRTGRVSDVAGRIPWELIALALAAASLYEILNRETSVAVSATGTAKVDKLLLLFPLLFLVGASALLVRGLRMGMSRLRAVGRNWPTPLFIAFRRMGTASGVAALLVAAVAVSTGILTFATSLQSSLANARVAKSKTFLGSDAVLVLGGDEVKALDAAVPASTLVERGSSTIWPRYRRVQLMAVDPATFARGAFWDRRFADPSLPVLMASLRGTEGNVPALVVSHDPLPPLLQLTAGPVFVTVQVARVLKTFPGAPDGDVVVVDRTAFARAVGEASLTVARSIRGSVHIDHDVELWTRSGLPAVRRSLAAQEIPIAQQRTAAQIRSSSAFAALAWTFGFMKGVGGLIGLVAVVILLLYLQGRQRAREVSYALARRMGLGATAHGAALLLELAGLLLIALGIGAGLATVAARLTFTRLDPLPKIEPGILMRLPSQPLAVSALVLGLGALLGSALAQARASRTNVAEVLRIAV